VPLGMIARDSLWGRKINLRKSNLLMMFITPSWFGTVFTLSLGVFWPCGYSFSQGGWGTCLLDISTISLGGKGLRLGGIRNVFNTHKYGFPCALRVVYK